MGICQQVVIKELLCRENWNCNVITKFSIGRKDNMTLKCDRCGEDIRTIEDSDSMDRGLAYDYDILCLDCWEELESEDQNDFED